MDHAQKIVEILGFPGIDFSFGPYFEAAKAHGSRVQIDLLFNRADKVITLCEMKYSQSLISREIITHVEKRVTIICLVNPMDPILIIIPEITLSILISNAQ